MSNMTLFSGTNAVAIPDYLRGADDFTKQLAGGGGSMRTISIRGGVWRLMDGKEEIAKNEDRAMQFVIVNAAPKVSRTFYLAKYEEGKDIAPTCWSADGVAPNDEVPVEQRQSDLCAKCPQNVEGSGEGKSRACRFSQRLAVALENDLEGGVYRLQLPAKSLFGKADGDKMPLQAYARFLAGHGVPISGVVTEARFDTSEAVPVLKFRAVRPLTREEFEVVRDLAQSDESNRAIEFKMVIKKEEGGEDEAPPAAPAPAARVAKTATRSKPAPAPAPAPAVDEDDQIDEPVVKKSKPAAAEPAPTPGVRKVSELLGEWGEDDDE